MSDANFSTLEAVSPEQEPSRNGEHLSADHEKQVAIDGVGKHIVSCPAGLEPAGQQHLYWTEQNQHEPQIHEPQSQPQNRKWLWVGIAALLVIILAAVLGGVLGSKKGESSPTSSSDLTSPSNTTGTVSYERKIAAVSYAFNNINNTRVYFQENSGTLIEAANSATNTTWDLTTVGSLKNETALAAAVSRPNFPLEISVYYTNENHILHDLVYNSTTHQWNEGTISKKNYVTFPNSSITALYNQCLLCANTTLVAYQDINGFVQIANLTSSGWILTQLDLDATLGTGLAMQPFYHAGQADQINLYYQASTLVITLASWHPILSSTKQPGWTAVEQTYTSGVPGTPLAAAASYTNVSSGFESWLQLLQLSTAGIEVGSWSGYVKSWLTQDNHPSTMANSTANVKYYKAIAVTPIGSAFAVVQSTGNDSIQSWQVNENLLDWTSTGTVAIIS